MLLRHAGCTTHTQCRGGGGGRGFVFVLPHQCTCLSPVAFERPIFTLTFTNLCSPRAAIKFTREVETAWLLASSLGFLLDVLVYVQLCTHSLLCARQSFVCVSPRHRDWLGLCGQVPHVLTAPQVHHEASGEWWKPHMMRVLMFPFFRCGEPHTHHTLSVPRPFPVALADYHQRSDGSVDARKRGRARPGRQQLCFLWAVHVLALQHNTPRE